MASPRCAGRGRLQPSWPRWRPSGWTSWVGDPARPVCAPERSYSNTGEGFTPEAQRALETIGLWSPIVTGVTALVGILIAARLVRKEHGVVWLAAAAAAPLLARAYGQGLAALGTGGQALDYTAGTWAQLAAGRLVGFAVASLARRR